MRAALNIPVSTQLDWASEFVAYRAWREAVERLAVLVCQFPGKGLGELRGTSILRFPLPVIGISSKELPLSKPFTLLHELVHVALAASREESPAVARNGPLLTSLVLSALSNEQISSTDAAKFLDVGFGHVEMLRKGWMERPTTLVGE